MFTKMSILACTQVLFVINIRLKLQTFPDEVVLETHVNSTSSGDKQKNILLIQKNNCEIVFT